MKNSYLIYFVIVGILTSSCGLIFEKSIEDLNVQMNAPADSATILQNTQLFSWEPVNYANTYRLQVYKNNFSSGIFLYDTTTAATQVLLSFQPGDYAWRVRAENSGSETAFHSGMLYVKKGDFTIQSIISSQPVSGFVSTTSAIRFAWQPLFDAAGYIIEIDTLTGNFSTPLIIDTIDASLTDVYKVIPSRGAYRWRMKAISIDNEQSLYTSPKNFSYTMADINLNAPLNGALVAKPISFQWSAITDVDYYKLYIYQSDSVTVQETQIASSNSFPISTVSVGGTYFWSVSAVDVNGVVGNSSRRIKFTVKP